MKMMTLEETREFVELVNPRVVLAAAVLVSANGLLTMLEDDAADVLELLGSPARFRAGEVRQAVMLARDGHEDGLFA